MLRVLPIIFFLLFLYPLRICAQQKSYVFQHLTSKDGLASERVTGILHDSRGFTWIGTNKGLQKFDGNSFTDIPYGENYLYTSNVSATTFTPVLEDKTGDIWVRIVNDITIYHPLTAKINRIEIYDDINRKGFNNIQSLCKDNEGEVWIITSLHLYKYDIRLQKPVLWLSLSKLPSTTTYLLFDKIKKGLWAVRDRQILFLNLKEKKSDSSFLNYLPKTGVTTIVSFWIDGNENLWISDWTGNLFKINTISHKRKIFILQNLQKNEQKGTVIVSSFIEDDNRIIWVGSSYGGLFYYNELKEEFEDIPSSNNYPGSFHYDFDIHSVTKDNEGNIWAGTDKGINIFNPASQQFKTVDENNLEQPFKKTEVNQIIETRGGDILISTWGNGWFIYDKDFRFKKHFVYKLAPNKSYTDKNFVWSFAEAGDGKIWIGYQHGLMSIYDTVYKSISYINETRFKPKTIRVMRCDGEGNIWFGLQSGSLVKWNKKTKTFNFYENILPPIKSTPAPISDILICPNGELWLATYNRGFYRFDVNNERIAEHYADTEKGSIFDNIISSLSLINDSIIGIATSSKGFLLFNYLKKTFTSVTKKDGLPTNQIFGIAQDKQKNVWIAAPEGLYLKNNLDNKFISFDEEDGLLNKHFSQKIFKLKDGRLIVPTSTGFVYFSPEDIRVKQKPPTVQVTTFKIFDQSLLIDSLLSPDKTIDLKYNQNFITIGYSTTNFMERNSTRYFYQLVGTDKDWVDAGLRRFATYTGLTPGHYTFKLKSENRQGIRSTKITELSIRISPPWWFTWWAYALYILISATFVYALYRNYINQLEKKQSAQIRAIVATQEEERKRISRDLHDDVGTKLSALKLFLSSLKEKASDTNNTEIKSLAESSEQFITEAMQDVRQLLLNLSPAVLEEFGYTTAVEGLVNKINETKQIYFSLVVFGMKQRLQKDYELALYRITQELINNVLKHAHAKHVSLQIGQRDEKIILMMEDDGKGFDVNAHKDGYGLHNLDARTKLMQGTMTIDSHTGKGTSVLIEIPYG